MRIVSVRAHPFGPLQDQELEFGPGLTVVAGVNESGKSSWHAATTAALAGKRPRQRKVDGDIGRYRPWNDDRWAVSCVVELDSGRRLRLVHNLATSSSQAFDDATGADLTGDYVHDGAVDASVLAGLSRMTLSLVSSISQADILALSMASAKDQPVAALRDLLQKAVSDRSAGGSSAEQAMARLEKFRTDNIGSTRSGSSKPLRAAQEALASAEEAQRHAEAAWELHRVNEGALDQAQADTVALLKKAKRAAQIEWASAREAAQRELARARELQDQVHAGDEVRPADAALVARVRRAVASLEQRPIRPPAPDRSVAEIDAEIAGVPEAPGGDLRPRPEVEQLAAHWKSARAREAQVDIQQPEQALAPNHGFTAAELRDAAALLEQEVAVGEASGTIHHRPYMFAAVLAMLIVVAGIVLGSAVTLGLGVGLVAAVAVGGGLATRVPVSAPVSSDLVERQDAVRANLRDGGMSDDPLVLRMHAHKADDARAAAHLHDQWRQASTRAAELTRDAMVELVGALRSTGVLASDTEVEPADVEALVDEYRDSCQQRFDQHQAANALAGLVAQRQAAKQQEGRIQEFEHAATSLQEELLAVSTLAALGSSGGCAVETTDPTAFVAQFTTWLKTEEHNMQRFNDGAQAQAALTEILRGRTWAELELATEADDPAELPAAMLTETSAAQQKVSHLEGTIAESERNLVGLAHCREAVLRCHREYDRLVRLDELIGTTLASLTEARQLVHQDIAPLLAAATNDRLARVSAGRYKRIRVDPEDLSVQVELADGTSRPAEQLSHGTTEQIYLLARVAIAELVSGETESCPLLLDDVTVHADEERTEAILAVLAELSADRQVVLFSQEKHVHEWARRVGASVIQLPCV